MKIKFHFRFNRLIIPSVIVIALMLVSCGNPYNGNSTNPENNPVSVNSNSTGSTQQAVTLSMDNPLIKAIVPVQAKYTPELMQKDGVVGTAIGLDENGKPAILVLAKTDILSEAAAKGQTPPIPDHFGNVQVRLYVSGDIKPLQTTGQSNGKSGNHGGGKSGGGTTVSHTAIQTPPIQLGTSGGWEYDNSNGYCCSGTLGSLITDGTNYYILSNYHVFYGDIVPGGNNRIAQAGDPVIQPGLVDVNCDPTRAQEVATLVTDGGSLTNPQTRSNTDVDAGIAKVISGMVDLSGSILEIGTISHTTTTAYINQSVKKSGRTTGLSTSTVVGLNATVSVSYENECAGSTAFTQTYTGQIIIDNKGSKFLNAGDSGSLMVENVNTNPRAVGLLFAGSNRLAVANPINDVLNYYDQTLGGNFTMVGQ